MNYIANNSTIRTLINRIEYLSLPLSLDMITELENAVSAISADSSRLTVRWYPLRSTKAYGIYCYPLNTFKDEFHFDDERDITLYEEISSLSSGSTLWAFRNISRTTNNVDPVEKRLCLYTQLGNYGVSDCILELTVPISQYFGFENTDEITDSLFAFCIPKSTSSSQLIWDAVTDSGNKSILLDQFFDYNDLEDYHIIRSPIPNIEHGEVIFMLPEDYVANLIRPQLINFMLIVLLITGLLIYISTITSRLLARQYELKNLRMELEILQLRFNPHLLYNTLNALCFQVKSPSVRDTIGSLCQYYRIILNNGYLLISVKNELEMIREYLKIECFAYALDDIQIKFEVEEEILEYKMIKHLLQPIVENALNHGLRPLEKGTLLISASSDHDCILFKISDNGVGISPQKITELLKPPKNEHPGGYGIYNVEQRIHIYYGSQYGLNITSNPTSGTTVILRLPKEC